MFVCHGNICRSPMAEFVMKDIVRKTGLESEILVESAATSTEEIGNDIHRGTRQKLTKENIPFTQRSARQITSDDYQKFDYLIGMDDENIFNMRRRWNNDPENKIFLLLEFAGKTREITDPWYTGNFENTYSDIVEGCNGLMKDILKRLGK
ncbi:low molecular weight protein-tyrosine-phosphatase [Treponema sp. Marseille-Q3903]|uniref:low molecular weight protein-tyrosine-phosphatase n=1 Tax=Treponema sp. Marseille-Q3903 TaxID=2766703 RepID=UPI002107383C|nr:low molecular weight protein-tyrosine-phosphatase [Treponema sp. Marseille-Q3903]